MKMFALKFIKLTKINSQTSIAREARELTVSENIQLTQKHDFLF